MKSIAIVGATGAVGKEIIKVLSEKNITADIKLFGSARSAGTSISTPFGEHQIEEFSLNAIQGYETVFLCVSGDFSRQWAKKIVDQGSVVIDNSSAFRYEKDIPLVVPPINIQTAKGKNLIANPNCTTAILGMPLFPIYKKWGLKKVIVSTYQAASGAGEKAMQELKSQSIDIIEGKEVTPEYFAHPLAFNVIPQIDVFQENGYTKEEMKVTWETQKIFNDENIDISCSAVRIPTLRAHGESVVIETKEKVTPEEVRALLQSCEGVDVVDTPEELKYPMPLSATKKYNVEIGRIRSNIVFGEYGLEFFIVGDQLLRGAALNAVEIMIEREKLS